MLLKEDKFTKFMLYTWINCDKFKGASRVSAMFLNILFGIFKFLVCGVIMLIFSPHIGVQSLRKKDLNFGGKFLLCILTIISLIFDIPIILLALFFVIATLQSLMEWTFSLFLCAIIFGAISYFLIRLSIILLGALFYKDSVESKATIENFDSTANDNFYSKRTLATNDSNQTKSVIYLNSVNTLWTQGTELDWHNALNYYYAKLSKTMRELDFFLEHIKIEDVKKMTINEFYDFLHDKFYVWKYTGTYLPKRQRDLEKYVSLNELNKLEEIKDKLFLLNPNDISECLQIVTEIKGLGVAGGSALLSILFPEKFGTVDKFLMISLQKISNWQHESELAKMNPKTAISKNNGVFLIKVLREKASELNKRFNTDFWTPRKIDMILWAIER